MTLKVIKLGGRVQSDVALISGLKSLWDREPGSFCVVHDTSSDMGFLFATVATSAHKL